MFKVLLGSSPLVCNQAFVILNPLAIVLVICQGLLLLLSFRGMVSAPNSLIVTRTRN